MPYKSHGLVKPRIGALVDWGHPLTRGLVLAYPMNEGSGNVLFNAAQWNCNPPGPNNINLGFYDLSSHAGFSANSGIDWTPGLLDSFGLTFNGTAGLVDKISVAAPFATSGFDTTGLAYSLQAWINYGATQSPFSGDPTIVCRTNSSLNTDDHFRITVGAANRHLQRHSGFDSGFVINPGQTYHIVYTFDASGGDTFGTEKFYVNAQLVASRTGVVPASVTGPGILFQIGTSPSDFAQYVGQIDWPMFYVGRALTLSDVEWLYEEPFAIFPIALYRRILEFSIPPGEGQILSSHVTEELGVTDVMARIVNIGPTGCCPCNPADCTICLTLPDTLYATVIGSGHYCSCIMPDNVIPLHRTTMLCQVGTPGAVTTGWFGQGSFGEQCQDQEIQIMFCCWLMGGHYGWLVQIQTTDASGNIDQYSCNIGGFTTPGESCMPLAEAVTFLTDVGLKCCNPLSNDPADPDTIMVTVTT